MQNALSFLFDAARSMELAVGETFVRTGQTVEEMFLVRTGRVHLCRHTIHGAAMVLQNAAHGMVVAEASAYSATYHCDAVVAEASQLSALPKPLFLRRLAEDPGLSASWAAMLARGAQAARLRAEIRSLPKVADRLDAWLSEGNALPQKGQWQVVAAELGVTREALYRELARRR